MTEAVVAVATSGGRDSLALLHATLHAAHPLGVRVVALHVHHGLLVEADGWADALERRCAQWSTDGLPVDFVCARLSGAPGPGDSVEAWARRERYAALARMAHAAGATLVLLGHHRRDQAETVLLQALRGAGAAGLAAMPRVIVRDGLTWARPWLDQADAAIDAYVAPLRLDFARDPSNADPRFARSRLRLAVMPALRTAFPDAENALLAVARHAQEARAVLAEVAREDLARIVVGAELVLEAWRALQPARRANALRAWLARHAGHAAPDTLVRRLLDELGDDAPRRWPLDERRGLRSWRGRLALVDRAASSGAPAPETALSLLRCAEYVVPGWAGRLEVFATAQGGVAPRRLARVLARARAGGERFQLQPAGTARGLKKQYQAVGIASEGRDGPLLFDAQGELLFAPGLGVDARAWAGEGAPQWGLRWRACAQGEG
jgi:tRNA(Ile)-lysidine synthase